MGQHKNHISGVKFGILDSSLIELAFNNFVYSDIFMDARWAELPFSKQDPRLKNWGYSYK
jgi:hypothetical protein